MSKTTYPLNQPRSQVGSVETAEAFLARRKGKATGAGLAAFLDRVPAVPPQAGDERPDLTSGDR